MVLAKLHEAGEITDSSKLAQELGADHDSLVGIIKSLESADMIITEVPRS